MSDDLEETKAVKQMFEGDFRAAAPFLLARNERIINVLAMLMEQGEIGLVEPPPFSKKTSKHLRLGRLVALRVLKTSPDGSAKKANVEAAVIEIGKEQGASESTVWRAWKTWEEMAGTQFPRHLLDE